MLAHRRISGWMHSSGRSWDARQQGCRISHTDLESGNRSRTYNTIRVRAYYRGDSRHGPKSKTTASEYNDLPPKRARPNTATNNETAGNPYRPHDMITRHFPKLKTISLEQLGHMINALALPSRFFRMITVTMWNATDTTICICPLMELATRRCFSAGVRMHHWP